MLEAPRDRHVAGFAGVVQEGVGEDGAERNPGDEEPPSQTIHEFRSPAEVDARRCGRELVRVLDS